MTPSDRETSSRTLPPSNDGPAAAALRRRLAEMFPEGVPNIYRTLSRHPEVMAALLELKRALAGGVLSEGERCLVALEVACVSECGYCHTALSQHGRDNLGMGERELSAPGQEDLPENPRLSLVLQAARAIIARQGRLERAEIAWFEDRGLGFEGLLEIIAVISEYTMATYSANLDRTRIDPEYRRS